MEANAAYTTCSGSNSAFEDVEHSCAPFKTVTSNYPNKCSGGNTCFSASDKVMLPSGAAIMLNKVRIGDEILTADADGEFSFAKVVSMPHPINSELTSFLEIGTDSGKVVRATDKHLMVTCDGSLARADSLRTGDCLRSVDGDDLIAQIQLTYNKGFMTVVTENEFVVINGLVASPFAVTHSLVHWYYNIHRFMFKYFPSVSKSDSVIAANAAFGSVIGSTLLYIASFLDVEDNSIF